MLDATKTDRELGWRIHLLLSGNGVETPCVDRPYFSPKKKISLLEPKFREVMEVLGMDLKDDSLRETPRRMAKMFINDLYWGLDWRNFPKVTTIENKMQYDSMLIERDIKVISSCEHHFVTMYGRCNIAYIPGERVIGLSKLNRIVEYFSHRPQVQERLTEQIFYTLQEILKTEDVAVLIKAEHFCVKARGVEDLNADTITTRLGGAFNMGICRSEFLNSLKL